MKIKQVDSSKRSVTSLLTALQQTCLPYDKLYETNGGYWWTVTDDSGVACAFAGLAASVRWGDTGYLCRAGVVPSHRGQGLQKKLIRVRINKARALGWQWLVTDTYNNPASTNSLIACGFKMFEPSVPWGGAGTLYWRKKL